MRKKKQLFMAALCALSMMINSVAAVAQTRDKRQELKPGVDPAQEPVNLTLSAPASGFTFIQSEFSFGGPPVKDAPYSAEAVTETIQTFADGNRIIHNSSSKIYRDSAGRTRHEQSLKAIGPWGVSGEPPVIISINDPVSSVHYSLNSNTKIAHKMMPLHTMTFDPAAMEKIRGGTKVADGAEAGSVGTAVATGGTAVATLGNSSSGPSNTVVSVAPAGAAAGRLSLTRGTFNTFGVGMAPGVPVSAPNGIFSWSGEGEVNMESLGKQMIEGVEAVGQRVTVTIQAGKIGNERPIITTNERWYSPELRTVVFSKNSDPRIGETTYKLINIDRSEPDSSLFQVPSDYVIEERPGFGLRGMPAEIPAMPKKKRVNEN